MAWENAAKTRNDGKVPPVARESKEPSKILITKLKESRASVKFPPSVIAEMGLNEATNVATKYDPETRQMMFKIADDEDPGVQFRHERHSSSFTLRKEVIEAIFGTDKKKREFPYQVMKHSEDATKNSVIIAIA